MRSTPNTIRPVPILHVGRFARVVHRKVSVLHYVDGYNRCWYHMRFGWYEIL